MTLPTTGSRITAPRFRSTLGRFGLVQLKERHRVVLEDSGADLVLDRQIGEGPEPLFGGDQRKVGAKEELARKDVVCAADQRFGKVLRRPSREVDEYIGLMRRDR